MLRLGFEKILDQSLHLDGTITVGGGTSTASKAINGLDFLVPFDSRTGTVGGIDRASNSYWRSNFDTGSGLNTFGTTSPTGYAHADLLAAMHTMWRLYESLPSLPIGRWSCIWLGLPWPYGSCFVSRLTGC